MNDDRNNERISGGFVLLARALGESQLWNLGPDCLRLAVWLLMRARFAKSPSVVCGISVGRGEVLTSLAKISAGCAWWENRTEKQWPRQTIARHLEKLCQIGFCEHISDSVGTHVRVCNYERYQLPENYISDNCGTTVEQLWNNCGTTVEQLRDYNKKDKKENKGKNENNGEISCPAIPGLEDVAPEEPTPKPRLSALDRQAEEIYQAYPKRVGKVAAIKAIRKVLSTGPLPHVKFDDLLAAVKAFADATKGADMNFVPHPATWFNQGRYEDDQAEWRRIGRDGRVQMEPAGKDKDYSL